MRPPSHIVVGRLPDCDVPIPDPAVSGRHARLSWLEDGRILVEDLGSANGTFIEGTRVARGAIRVGDAVQLGSASLPWSHPRVVAFLRARSGGGTMVMNAAPAARRRKRSWLALLVPLVAMVALGGALALVLLRPEEAQEIVTRAAEPVRETVAEAAYPVGSPQEAEIRAHRLAGIDAAIDADAELTRNTAVQIASRWAGTFSIDQVAQLWMDVRGRWSYVNDPRGREYFARASETIANGFAGDCDDFAITIAAFVTAIGGVARIVLMESDKGGHAYPEVCIAGTPDEVKRALVAHFRSRRAGSNGRRVRTINYRTGTTCGVWLNLDWNGELPGGPYEPEHWAVAVYPDGRTETLAPAGAPTAEVGGVPAVQTASPPASAASRAAAP
jgi:hypothetical protein